MQGLCQEGGSVQGPGCYPVAQQGCDLPAGCQCRGPGHAVPQCSQDQQEAGVQPAGSDVTAHRPVPGTGASAHLATHAPPLMLAIGLVN